MSLPTKLLSLWPSRRRATESDMREELESVAALAGSNGARPGLGSLTRAAEEARSVWTFVWLEQLYVDVPYAARVIRGQPGFAAAAVFSLALGIGATTAIFSLAHAILLKELPVRVPGSLAMLTSYTRDGRLGDFGYRGFLALRESNSALAGLLAASRIAPVTAILNGEPEILQRKNFSANYFDLLGVRPVAGRTFYQDDDDQPVAVIGHGLWQRRYSASPSVNGARIDLNGLAFTVVGVAGPGFFSETIGEDVDVRRLRI